MSNVWRLNRYLLTPLPLSSRTLLTVLRRSLNGISDMYLNIYKKLSLTQSKLFRCKWANSYINIWNYPVASNRGRQYHSSVEPMRKHIDEKCGKGPLTKTTVYIITDGWDEKNVVRVRGLYLGPHECYRELPSPKTWWLRDSRSPQRGYRKDFQLVFCTECLVFTLSSQWCVNCTHTHNKSSARTAV